MGTRAIEKAPSGGDHSGAGGTRFRDADADLALGMHRLVLVMKRQENGWGVAEDYGNGRLRPVISAVAAEVEVPSLVFLATAGTQGKRRVCGSGVPPSRELRT